LDSDQEGDDPDVLRDEIEDHLRTFDNGKESLLAIPIRVPLPPWSQSPRPLRGCIVQTVLPSPKDFDKDDLTFSGREIRKRHRNHLATALAAVKRMLDLRETHKGRDGRLDWLILPELSVHPLDVPALLLPFVRAYKTLVLAGLTYQNVISGNPLINSAIWIIPTWSKEGFRVLTRRQGKQHLSAEEKKFNDDSVRLEGFRPCQWLVGYEWYQYADPLWLTGAICYDATDLGLAAQLRNKSDVFAIPALNRDVGTFDHMALALHFHMFQLVIVANNGMFGGSNGYAPYIQTYERQVFHLHGQPQASMAFFEIDDIQAFKAKRQRTSSGAENIEAYTWKSPPAGLDRVPVVSATTNVETNVTVDVSSNEGVGLNSMEEPAGDAD
jgi:hypothetical protein